MNRRSLLKSGMAGTVALAAPLLLSGTARAQGAYRAEYRLSTVVGTAFRGDRAATSGSTW